MNSSREEALLELALKQPGKDRAAFLDAMCVGDPILRPRLETLLTALELVAQARNLCGIFDIAIVFAPDYYA
jgi:hypothetical protein